MSLNCTLALVNAIDNIKLGTIWSFTQISHWIALLKLTNFNKFLALILSSLKIYQICILCTLYNSLNAHDNTFLIKSQMKFYQSIKVAEHLKLKDYNTYLNLGCMVVI